MSSITLWPILHKLKTGFVSNIKSFCIFGENGNEVIIVTKNDKVFAFGDNKYGCLGLGHNNAVKVPEIVKELCDQQIIDISCGCFHVLALTKSGKCFSLGYNANGQLGNGTLNDENKPKVINALLYENVVQIACGSYHSLVVTKTGDLYGFGNKDEGEIGCGSHTNQLIPKIIIGFNDEKIVSITCGCYHSLVLTDVGNVYSWGWNSYGQLGIGNEINQKRPKKIILDDNEIIKSISCGYYHSLVLTTNDDIYAFGWNNFGQIGNGNNTNQLIPVKINESQKFKEIFSNHWLNISVAKAVDHFCYVWGQCENEEILTPQKTDIKSIDEILAIFSKIKITSKPIQLSLTSNDYNVRNVLLEKMLKLFDNPKYSDLKCIIQNKFIYVQKCIIQTNSKYFESNLIEITRAVRESTENKTDANVIEITEYSYDVYYTFLKYLYTDCIDIKPEKAMDLLVLANNYKEEELKLKCIDIIESNITLENVCALYCASIKYNLSDFEDFCFNFAINKMNQIFITEGFRQMDENSMKKFMERAAINNVFK